MANRAVGIKNGDEQADWPLTRLQSAIIALCAIWGCARIDISPDPPAQRTVVLFDPTAFRDTAALRDQATGLTDSALCSPDIRTSFYSFTDSPSELQPLGELVAPQKAVVASRAAQAKVRDTRKAKFLTEISAAAEAATKPTHSLIFEGITAAALQNPGLTNLIIISNMLEESPSADIHFERSIPSPDSLLKSFDHQHILPPGSLSGVTVYIAKFSPHPISPRRQKQVFADHERLEQVVRAVLLRAGAKSVSFFPGSVPLSSHCEVLP